MLIWRSIREPEFFLLNDIMYFAWTAIIYIMVTLHYYSKFLLLSIDNNSTNRINVTHNFSRSHR